MNMTSYNQKSNTEGRCKTIDLPIQDVPDRMLMVVNMGALHDTPSLAHHHHQNVVRCCQTLQSHDSWITIDSRQEAGSPDQHERRRDSTNISSLHLSTKICFTSKLLPKMFYSWAKSWEPTMNMREWWNEKTKNINRNSMEHQYNIIHKPKTIKKLDCFTSSMKTIAHHHHSHFTTQTHSFKWHFKRSHEST